MKLELIREYHEDYTKGRLITPFGNFYTLELPYKNNVQRISAIPEGNYSLFKDTYVNKKGKVPKCFRFKKVEGRSKILIHKGNYTFEVEGCILVGMKFDDSLQMVRDSTIAFNLLWKYLPANFDLEIKNQEKSTDFVMFNDYAGLERKTLFKPKKIQSNSKKTLRNLLYAFLFVFLFNLFLKRF